MEIRTPVETIAIGSTAACVAVARTASAFGARWSTERGV
jgi:hypothetical protein